MTVPLAPDRRHLRKAATRTAILDAAEHIVLTQGPRALTTKALVEQAGVSERTIFNHFPSLEDVLLARLNEHATKLKLIDGCLLLPEGAPLADRASVDVLPRLLEQRCRDRVSSLNGHEALVRAVRLALAMVERDEDALHAYTSQMLSRAARESIEELLAAHDLTSEQQYELAIYVNSLCHSIAFGLDRAMKELSPGGDFEAITDTTRITPYLIWAMDRVSAGRPHFSQK
ncbi:TetR/AcrR family transcriptional regulator [Rothia nasimurium]|uniref:TetR/AcrR family transcriptional regulator n=1 Tax=Rothia nasimurium TaxID=85336 RepID=UPI001F1C753E|nr:TetR/AcrR family transcriptional regulator [Rothia nasimurium]